jgi:hypothetical protein
LSTQVVALITNTTHEEQHIQAQSEAAKLEVLTWKTPSKQEELEDNEHKKNLKHHRPELQIQTPLQKQNSHNQVQNFPDLKIEFRRGRGLGGNAHTKLAEAQSGPDQSRVKTHPSINRHNQH